LSASHGLRGAIQLVSQTFAQCNGGVVLEIAARHGRAGVRRDLGGVDGDAWTAKPVTLDGRRRWPSSDRDR
jgi:hypothetical protein